MEGNQMKMRDALETVRKYVKETTPDKVMLGVIEVWCDEALSAPPRQCDVGTADEQAKRMDVYCASHGERIDGGWRCDNCPLCSIDRCDLVWAQMPYKANGGEGYGVQSAS